MKKLVSTANIIFWLSLLILAHNSQPNVGWLLGIMVVCSLINQWGSTPNPKLKKGRYYKLEKIIPQKNGFCSIILSYDDEIETYKCREILASFNPQIGSQYLVEIENGSVFFTPV